MTPEISKLKTLYQQLDRQQVAGEDVVADLKKEINNLELAYLKEHVFPQVARFMASKVNGLRCEVDSSFQFDGGEKINYSFCTSGSMLFVKDSIEVNSANDIFGINTPHAKSGQLSIIDSISQPNTPQPSIRLVDYSEKAVAVFGDTREFSDKLKNLGGYFNPRLRGGVGWVFAKKKIPELLELLAPYLQSDDAGLVEDKAPKSKLSSHAVVDDKSFLSEDQWIKMLLSMKGTQVKGLTTPHKAIFILTIIESIKRGFMRDKRIFATSILSDIFIRIWEKYVPSDWPFRANVFHPYIHMSSEPFYFLVNAEGVSHFDINQNWNRNLVARYVEYAYFNTQLFELLHNQSFTDRLSKALIDKYLVKQVKARVERNQDTQTNPNANAFTGYKRYLSTLISNTGRPYSASSISVYATALRSKYMQAKVSKFAGTTNLELVSDLSVIDSIICEVKYEAELGMVSKSSYFALKMFRNYRRLNPITLK